MAKTLDAILANDTQTTVCEALQSALYDLIALARITKQAHWNVFGPSFRSVHLHLDEIYAILESQVDVVAERCSALGISPSGQSAEVAKKARVQELPLGFLKDAEVVQLMTERVETMGKNMRGYCEKVEDLDVVTADLFHGMLAKLEMQAWMLRSQRS